jgi:hypothetical protein
MDLRRYYLAWHMNKNGDGRIYFILVPELVDLPQRLEVIREDGVFRPPVEVNRFDLCCLRNPSSPTGECPQERTLVGEFLSRCRTRSKVIDYPIPDISLTTRWPAWSLPAMGQEIPDLSKVLGEAR